jgi:hypothetical protein
MTRVQLIGVLSLGFVIGVATVGSLALAGAELQATPARLELREASSFDSIADRAERSRAIFREAGKVIQSPRCLNCHPHGETPTQGDDLHAHFPPVTRGPHDDGVVGMNCTTCHQDHNLELSRVPGAPQWHLAPLKQFWAGRSLPSICELLKDPKRNGHRTLDQLVEHFGKDELVGWAWHPGNGRVPAPGTQKRMGELIAAWAATGAACPTGESK